MGIYVAPVGMTVNHRYRVSWMTPAAVQIAGGGPGTRAGSNNKLPWIVNRRCIEAMERCFDSGLAVAWFEPGEGAVPPTLGQVFPLPLGQGVLVTAADGRMFGDADAAYHQWVIDQEPDEPGPPPELIRSLG